MTSLPLRVFVIEEHTEALEVLSLAARRRLVNLNDCTLVHLDSHPDLSCFELIGPEHIRDRTELCHRLRNSEDGISSFILPGIAMGLVRDVIWIKPPWTEQIPEGDHNLTFGWTTPKNGGRMAIWTELDYWHGDGNSVPHKEDLVDTTTFDLRVQQVEDWLSSRSSGFDNQCGTSKKQRISLNNTLSIATGHQGGTFHSGSWVLDICLDYFSCANPLHEPDLPEHVSTAEEIEQMLRALREGLAALHTQGMPPPSLCIIARSEQDGFTPGEVAAGLEDSVQAMLKDVYSETKIYNVTSFEKFYDVDFIRSV
jgi:hypothetical protein